MKILVTAGATMTMIDQVRAITNIFKGRTGTDIARYLHSRHEVTLLTSNPELAEKQYHLMTVHFCRVIKYKTFDDLAELMEHEVRTGNYDVIIHSAAVSDYQVDGIETPTMVGRMEVHGRDKKISSSHDVLYLRLVPTFKIVDKIRSEWGFKGKLVKFKLQVGISETELLKIAMKSREDSDADFIVANCLEWASQYALIVDRDNIVERVTRQALPEAIERRLK